MRIITEQNSDQRKWRVRMLLLHGAMIAAPLALLLVHARFHVYALGICAFKSIFGVDCPACGITHSAMALFNGHIVLAFHHHPAGPLVVTVITLMAIYLAVVLLTEFKGLEWGKEVKAYTRIEILAVGALLIGWIGKVVIN